MLRGVASGELEVVQVLLAAGANTDAAAVRSGWTPLHYAADAGYTEVVQALLAAGAKTDARDADGMTPMHLAARAGCGDGLLALMSGGADIDARAADGRRIEDVAAGPLKALVRALRASRAARQQLGAASSVIR